MLFCVSLEPVDARRVLLDLLDHHAGLSAKLGQDLDIRVSAMDYATRHPQLVQTPVVVDQSLFALSQRLAAVDELTGLFNRRFLDSYLLKELNRARRYEETFSVFFIDIDDFKHINDTHGHAIGDRVLTTLGKEVLDLLRKEDFAARYGGEEFLVVLPHTESDGARRFAERLTARVSLMELPGGSSMTFSGGIATFPDHGFAVQDLLRNADMALYQAKVNGKAHVRVASPDKRSAPRHSADLRALCFLDDHEVGEVRLRDISRAGVSLESDASLIPGQTIRFRFIPSPAGHLDRQVEVYAQVIWSRRIADVEYRIGGRWATNDTESVRELINEVASE